MVCAISLRWLNRRTPEAVSAVFSPVLWPSIRSGLRSTASTTASSAMLAANTDSAATSIS